MAKLTAKQEAFCLKYIEVKNLSEAYRATYSCDRMKSASVNSCASKLMGNLQITSRIEELEREAAERNEVTVDSLAREYEEARKLGIEQGQISASVSATTGKARLFGLDKQKVENTHSGSVNLSNLSDDELKRIINGNG